VGSPPGGNRSPRDVGLFFPRFFVVRYAGFRRLAYSAQPKDFFMKLLALRGDYSHCIKRRKGAMLYFHSRDGCGH